MILCLCVCGGGGGESGGLTEHNKTDDDVHKYMTVSVLKHPMQVFCFVLCFILQLQRCVFV